MAATFYKATRDGAVVFIRARPGAAKNEFAGLRDDGNGAVRLIVRVTAAPEKGKANAAIIKLLASAIGAPRSCLSIIAGETSGDKTLSIEPADKAMLKAISQLSN